MGPAEGFFVNVAAVGDFQAVGDLPAVGSENAVFYGELLAFRGVQVIFVVGVPGENNFMSLVVIFLNLRPDLCYDSLSFRGAQRAGDKVVLYVYDNEGISFYSRSFLSYKRLGR